MPTSNGVWTKTEHVRFLEGLKIFRKGNWKQISKMVGTRTPRQTRTHAQKYYAKLQRWRRGLIRNSNNSVHEIVLADRNEGEEEPNLTDLLDTEDDYIPEKPKMMQVGRCNVAIDQRPPNERNSNNSASENECIDWLLDNFMDQTISSTSTISGFDDSMLSATFDPLDPNASLSFDGYMQSDLSEKHQSRKLPLNLAMQQSALEQLQQQLSSARYFTASSN